jgi:hypothetical protein
MTGPLRDAGIPQPGEGREVWYWDRALEAYRPQTGALRALGSPVGGAESGGAIGAELPA